MSFVRWLKYRLIRFALAAAAALSFVGGAYLFARLPGPFNAAAIIAGFALGAIFLIGRHYYKIKAENLFFLPEKKRKHPILRKIHGEEDRIARGDGEKPDAPKEA